MFNINLCDYHKKMKQKTIVTDDDINSCLNCFCNECCNPAMYCTCKEGD